MIPEKIAALEAALKTAAAIAKEMVSDAGQQSGFAAAIRSNVDHAAALLGFHQEWLATRPAPTAAPAPAQPAATAAPAPAQPAATAAPAPAAPAKAKAGQ